MRFRNMLGGLGRPPAPGEADEAAGDAAGGRAAGPAAAGPAAAGPAAAPVSAAAGDAGSLLPNLRLEQCPEDTHLRSSEGGMVATYFHYYGKFSTQMNMLQDAVRTNAYAAAIAGARADFVGRRVMDVGAGSGILSFFAAAAGASRVYAVEASDMARAVELLRAANPAVGAAVTVVNKPLETVSLAGDLHGERVDVLVSEPIGTFLFNERMIETYLFARDNFLAPGGKMFPSHCRLFLAPFSDAALYAEYAAAADFWKNTQFHGIDISAVAPLAALEHFRQPAIDYIDPACLVGDEWLQREFDLCALPREDLRAMSFSFSFPIGSPAVIHGLASWFDVLFPEAKRAADGSAPPAEQGFSTAPWCPPTHWNQIRFVFTKPLAANAGDKVFVTLTMTATPQQSYIIKAWAQLEGTEHRVETTDIDLKDPNYRYYSNPQASYQPPVPLATVAPPAAALAARDGGTATG